MLTGKPTYKEDVLHSYAVFRHITHVDSKELPLQQFIKVIR